MDTDPYQPVRAGRAGRPASLEYNETNLVYVFLDLKCNIFETAGFSHTIYGTLYGPYDGKYVFPSYHFWHLGFSYFMRDLVHAF